MDCNILKLKNLTNESNKTLFVNGEVCMESFFQGVYDFFSNNIILITVVLVLVTIATILEKSEKIATPISTLIKKHKAKRKREEEMFDAVQTILTEVQELKDKDNEKNNHFANIDSKLDDLSARVLENEADRLRDVLFGCGNNCRRGIFLDTDSYRHIQEVYLKYSETLHKNGPGKQEYNYITNYYNSQDFSKDT